jgi:hypothetical protein
MKLSKHISLTLLAGLLAACAAPSTLTPAPNINELKTFVAETAFAAQTQSAVPGGSILVQTGTSTFTPTPQLPTPSLTETLPPASIFSTGASIPIIHVSVATNCRSGPGKAYPYVGALLVGKVAEVHAGDPTGDYWYIPNPDSPGDFCWVWGQYATILGNTSALPIYTPPPTPTATFTPLPTSSTTPGPDFEISYTGMDKCSGDWWVEINLQNDGAFDFRSAEIKVWDKNTDTTLSKLTDGFINNDGCLSSSAKDTLPAGKSLIISSHTFGYNLSGHALRVNVKICTETGQGGVCVKKQIEFAP